MTKTRTLAEIADAVAFRTAAYKAQLAKFQENLAANPVYAFEWGEEAMGAAVRLRVLEQLGSAAERPLDDGQTEEQRVAFLAGWFESEAQSKARRVPRSTSMLSNRIEDLDRACYADVAAWFRHDLLGSL